jgi:RNA polymerase sigma-70 factor, ECF subfamily
LSEVEVERSGRVAACAGNLSMQHDDTLGASPGSEPPLSPVGAAPEVREAAAGEPADTAQLFDKYGRYVAKIGGTILGRGDEVDDVIQDVFLAVHHDLHNLRDAARVKGWIATITVRIARQRLAERLVRRRIREIPPAELEVLATAAASAEHKTDLSGRLQAMLELPPIVRAPWLLKYVENEPLERIAALCSCSESTAQRRIRAAEASMRGARIPQLVDTRAAVALHWDTADATGRDPRRDGKLR